MKFNSVEDIFAANARIRESLLMALEELSNVEVIEKRDSAVWSAANIVEHIAMVEDGSVRICSRLMTKAQADDEIYEGGVQISDQFWEKAAQIVDLKLEAPDIVRPTGNQTIEQSLERMRETQSRLNELKPLFKQFGGSRRTFPHPFFGELSAHEWLVLSGLHEQRHISQLKRLFNTDSN